MDQSTKEETLQTDNGESVVVTPTDVSGPLQNMIAKLDTIAGECTSSTSLSMVTPSHSITQEQIYLKTEPENGNATKHITDDPSRPQNETLVDSEIKETVACGLAGLDDAAHGLESCLFSVDNSAIQKDVVGDFGITKPNGKYSLLNVNTKKEDKTLNNNVQEQSRCGLGSDLNSGVKSEELKKNFQLESCIVSAANCGEQRQTKIKESFVEEITYSDADIQFHELSSGKSLIEQILALQSGGSVDDVPDTFGDNSGENCVGQTERTGNTFNEKQLNPVKESKIHQLNYEVVIETHASLEKDNVLEIGNGEKIMGEYSEPAIADQSDWEEKNKQYLMEHKPQSFSCLENKSLRIDLIKDATSHPVEIKVDTVATFKQVNEDNSQKEPVVNNSKFQHTSSDHLLPDESVSIQCEGKSLEGCDKLGERRSVGELKHVESKPLPSNCDVNQINQLKSFRANIDIEEKVIPCNTGDMECDVPDMGINQGPTVKSDNCNVSVDSSVIGEFRLKSVISGDSSGDVTTVETSDSIEGKMSSKVEALRKNSTDGQVPVDCEEPEFVWEDYLTETGAQAALTESFLHVETSLKNGFEVGQVVEMANKDDSSTYWYSRIVTVSGQLLGLCWINSLDFLQDDEDEDTETEFAEVDVWCDAFNSDLHPLGWCEEQGKEIVPPKAIESQIPDLADFLSTLQNAPTPASYLFSCKSATRPVDLIEADQRHKVQIGQNLPCSQGMLYDINIGFMKSGTSPVDFIKAGQWLEVQIEQIPIHVWPVRIIENVGGRLLLRYEGAKNAAHDFWLFYLNVRLHSLGWAKDKMEDGYLYEAPKFLMSDPELENIHWSELLTQTFTEAEAYKMPINIFQDQEPVKKHSFKEGMKLEASHPLLRCAICPATVTKVFNSYFFRAQIDDVSSGMKSKKYEMSCHRGSRNIFPVRWCVHNGLRLVPPTGWNNSVSFDWKEYIQECGAEAAPEKAFDLEVPDHEFNRGHKLEAVDPDHPAHLCVATIIRIVEQLMWIHLDSHANIGANHIVDVQSHDVFPIGWCESNDYPLKLPKKVGGKKRITSHIPIDIPMTADEYRSAAYKQIREGEGSEWCPKLFFNHLCFSGGFLSKGRIAELPCSVGPGPINLVMKEVLTMLINVAYKSSRVLRELQLEGTPNPTMIQQVLKAKYKGKSYRAVVEICKHSDQIEEFCRQVCIRLECCPLLISPYCVEGECPENCSQLTKTKYTACYLKNKSKRKQGRPPGGHSNLEGPKKPLGRKKKRKRGRPPLNREASALSTTHNGFHENGAVENESVCGSLDSSERLDDEVASINSKKDDGIDDELPRKKRKYDRRVLPPTTVKTRGVKLPSYGTNQHEKRNKTLKIKDILLPANANGLSVVVAEEFVRTGKKGRPRKVQTLMPAATGSAMSFPGAVTSPATVFKPIYTFKDETALKLASNPLHWSVQQVGEFIRGTDSGQFAKILQDQEIDGQALLMLSLPVVQEYLDYKLGPALKLCHHIERLKLAFYQQYT